MKKTLLLAGLGLTAIATPVLAEQATSVFKPQTVSFQYYMPRTSSWGEMNVEKYTYNPDGTVNTMEETGQKTVYTYDSDGRVIKEEVYSVYSGGSKLITATEYEYDPVIKNFVISETENYYQGKSEPLYTTGNGTEITRDGYGNITKVRTYNVANGNKTYDDDQMIVEYGSDGTAVRVAYEKLDKKNGQTISQIEEEWTNIVWDTTDGQILSMESDDFDSDMYFSSNRVASATFTSEDLPSAATFTATYDGDSYHSLLMMGKEKIREITFNCIEKFSPREDFDEYYSYDAEVFETEYDEENGQYIVESTVTKKESNRTDAYGFIILNEQTTTEHKTSGDKTETETKKTDVSYDEQSGYPIQATKWEKDDSDKDFQPVSMYFFNDYVKVEPASVTNLEAESADGDVEYFDLQGVRVSNPEGGIFIRREGTASEKVYLE